ncbi:MAG: hypothetical protein ACI9N0_002387 [Ilumatobacter sp.]|jgi:hypothetical protein
MSLDADPEWIRFPIAEPIVLSGFGCNIAVRVNEFAIQREGRRLIALDMTFVCASSSLQGVRAALRIDGPSPDAEFVAEPSREVLATLRFDPELLASLPSNVAVLRRRLSSSPLSELANWSLLSVHEIA